ncbi:MAG: thiol:disulfide interchange protein DsbA/DsbL [Burkholderiaceae bacterium]
MDKRKRMMMNAALGAAAASLAAPMPALAQGGPREGREYRLVKPVQNTEAPAGKLEVLEFFWYGCPHCNSLEPALVQWAKALPPDVEFRRVHVPFGDRRHQQLFYTLDAMGKAEELADKVFRAIHVEQNRLDTPEKMIALLSRHGVDGKQFTQTWDSFAVRTKIRRGTQLSEAYGIDGVPALAVNGRYVTAPSMVGSNPGALKVVEYLLAQERQRTK